MKRLFFAIGAAVACTASAQLLQNLTQALVQPEPAPAQPAQIVQPQQVVQPAVQQVTTTAVQPVQQVTTTTVQPAVQQVTTTTVQPVQQVTTTTVTPAAPVVVTPAPTIVVPAGFQQCPRCGGRGKEEHAMGFKLKRCKLCDGKGYLPPPPPPGRHRRYRRY